MTGRLKCTGGAIVDVVLTVDALPEPGGDTIASSSQLTAGGGYNVMIAAQRAGLPVVYAGRYGTGPMADVVRSALLDAGIAVVQPAADTDSGYCVVLVDRTAERTFVTAVGAEGGLTRADLDRVPVGDADVVHVTGYSLADGYGGPVLPGWLAALPGGTRVVTDPSPLVGELDPAVLGPTLRRTDVLSANAREAAVLTGLTDPEDAAAALVRRIRPDGLAVVRDGAAGCWLAGRPAGGTPVLVPGFAVAAVDTTGAGDTHGGVLAAELARGASPAAAAQRANAAAALSVTRRGPATAPTADEIDRFLVGTPADGRGDR